MTKILDSKIRLKTAILMILIILPIASIINFNDYFGEVKQEDINLKTSVPATPKYKYVYENDFDYYYHLSQSSNVYSIDEYLSGDDKEWSQNPSDSETLQFSYVCYYEPSKNFDAIGGVLVKSHNTFEKQDDSDLGAFIDWKIDLNIPYTDNINIEHFCILFCIIKPGSYEELITIENYDPQADIFYLANFSQYIWDDGTIRFGLYGLVSGSSHIGFDWGALICTVKFEGLRVIQELKPVEEEVEKRTLILVHGFVPFHVVFFHDTQPVDPSFWNTYLNSKEFINAYDNIIVISYYGPFTAYRYSKDENGVLKPDGSYYMNYFNDADTSITNIAAQLALYIMQDYNYINNNVDIICHSMGGLVTRCMIKYYYYTILNHYATLGRIFKVQTVCTIATPNHGTWYNFFLQITFLDQLVEMTFGSLFLWNLNNVGVVPGTNIPLSGTNINWFTYRSNIKEILGVPYDGVVETSSVSLGGAENKGYYLLDHGQLISSSMMNHVVFNDVVKPPAIILKIFNEGIPGKIMGIEDLTLEGRTLSITIPQETAVDIDPTSVYIEINPSYQMTLKDGTTDTYEVDLPIAPGDYAFIITANALDGSLYQISGNLKILPDTSAPIIIITSPTDGLITNEDLILIYTVSDDYTPSDDIVITGPESDTPYTTEGIHNIVITATDEAGNIASESVTFTIDKTKPVIDITSPIDGLITDQDVTLIYTVSDDYTPSDNIVITGPESDTSFTTEGIHNIVITATDEAGNTETESISFIIDRTAPVIEITSPNDGIITNQDVTLIYTVSDDVSAPESIGITGPDSDTIYTSEGFHNIVINAADEAGNIATASVSFTIDKSKPITSVEFGSPYVEINEIIYLTSATSITLNPEEIQGGSGIDKTYYRIFNSTTYDSGFITYLGMFTLNRQDFPGLYDGEYNLEYYSTDIAGNIEDPPKSKSIVLDNSPPDLSWEFEGGALQDGIQFEIIATDATGVDATSIMVSMGERNGPIIEDIIEGSYADGLWSANEIYETDTEDTPDGYYELVVQATDMLGHTITEVFDFSIRNWAVLVLLPATESNKAGRTMPVKFALHVAAAVDPEQPFVVNQELDIFINDTSTKEVLQHSTYGDSSKDYRINIETEHYITNFKTHKTPTTYIVRIFRNEFFIDKFTFVTVK